MTKIASNLPGIHDSRTLSSAGKRSIPPSPQSAFLDLYMRQTEKNRLIKERIRLQKKRKQINQKLGEINHNMARLFKVATKSKEEFGKKKAVFSKQPEGRKILEY